MGKRLRKPLKKEKTYSEKIVKILSQNANKVYNYKQIAAILDLDDTQSRNQIIKDLKILAAQKTIIESEPGKYLVKAISQDYYEGKIDMTGRKTAYFVCPDLEEDVFIPTNNLNRALDKDTVKIYKYNRKNSSKEEGDVVEIIKRAKTEFVGVLQLSKNFGFVVPDDAKMYADIFVAKNKLKNAEDGVKVLVKLTDWPENSKNPFGLYF